MSIIQLENKISESFVNFTESLKNTIESIKNGTAEFTNYDVDCLFKDDEGEEYKEAINLMYNKPKKSKTKSPEECKPIEYRYFKRLNIDHHLNSKEIPLVNDKEMEKIDEKIEKGKIDIADKENEIRAVQISKLIHRYLNGEIDNLEQSLQDLTNYYEIDIDKYEDKLEKKVKNLPINVKNVLLDNFNYAIVYFTIN